MKEASVDFTTYPDGGTNIARKEARGTVRQLIGSSQRSSFWSGLPLACRKSGVAQRSGEMKGWVPGRASVASTAPRLSNISERFHGAGCEVTYMYFRLQSIGERSSALLRKPAEHPDYLMYKMSSNGSCRDCAAYYRLVCSSLHCATRTIAYHTAVCCSV